MTFNAAVPLNSDSPSIFPTQNQTNMGRLQTIIGADHQFNLSVAGDDGYHNIIHMTQQAPSGALAATGRGYAKSANGFIHDFYMDDSGREFQITPTIPIYAACNFTGRTTNGAATINFNHNIASVMRTGSLSYTVNFAVDLPTNFYVVSGISIPISSFSPVFQIPSAPTYSTNVQTGFVNINAVDNGNTMILICGG